MDADDMTRNHLDRGRAEHLRGDDETARKHHEEWKKQAQQIEEGMADAVERAAAMGDRVEPSLVPPNRRRDTTPAEERDSTGDPEGVDDDRGSGAAHGA